MNQARMRYLMAILFVIAMVMLAFQARDIKRCWDRGGTAVRNVFDWPTCLEAKS